MRFLLDQPISWKVGELLQSAGHEVVHTSKLGLADAKDHEIVDHAAEHEWVIVTQDTDFGMLLSAAGRKLPSAIIFRMHDGRPAVQGRVLLRNLARFEDALREGAIVVVTDAAFRIRRLPIA